MARRKPLEQNTFLMNNKNPLSQDFHLKLICGVQEEKTEANTAFLVSPEFPIECNIKGNGTLWFG